MESVNVPGTSESRSSIEKPAIDLYNLTKKLQYHITRQEFEIAYDLLKDQLEDRGKDLKKMFGIN